MILNFGDPTDTLACLASLELSDDLDLDVVVVDNGPADDGHDRLRREVGGRAEVVATGANLGYAAGNNLGIARVLERGCDQVWILNPDTVVQPNTLVRLNRRLEKSPDCGIVGPRLLMPGDPPRIWSDGGMIDREAHGDVHHLNAGRLVDDYPPGAAHDVDYVTGASLLVRRLVVEQIGPIPEDYFLYFEETDWCLRARTAGWRVMVEPRARMVHHKRSSGALPMPYYLYYMIRNRYRFVEQCLGGDGEAGLAALRTAFVEPWRARVTDHAPSWLPTFDELVRLAEEDARSGVSGRRDEVSQFRGAEERDGNG